MISTGSRRFRASAIFCTAASALCLLVATPAARAGVILQNGWGGTWQIQAMGPVGQSFTAEDPKVRIAFSFVDFNPLPNPNVPVTMVLRAGTGTGGTLLGSDTQTLTPGLGALDLQGVLVDFEFPAVTLVPGNVYTALVQTSNGRWGVNLNTAAGSSYPGGVAIVEGHPEDTDLRFRVTPIPEPTTAAALASLAAVVAVRRRSRL